MNPKNEDILQQTVGVIKQKSLSLFPHELNICPNLIVPVDRWKKTTENPINYSNPIILRQNLNCGNELPEDHIPQLVQKKDAWSKRIAAMKKRYHEVAKVKRIKKCNLKWDRNTTQVPQHILSFSTALKADPDVHFEGRYNWYYTNGNFEMIQTNQEIIGFNANETSQSCLDILSFNFTRKILRVESKVGTYKFNIPIYEVEAIPSNSCGILLGIRHRSTYILAKINSDVNRKSLEILKTQYSSVPITSASLNRDVNHHMATISINRSLNVWDIQASAVVAENIYTKEFNDENIVDNWSNIRYLSANEILLMNRQTASMIDLRVNTTRKIFSFENPCDYFSCFCPSDLLSNCLYIGTFHSVLLLDRRFKKTFLKKWTHLMKSVPFVIKSMHASNFEEYVCLSSYLPHEKSIFINSIHNNYQHLPPKQLPSLEQSLKTAKLNGYCLNPFSKLNTTVKYSTSGIAFVKENQNINVAYQDSLGNIFYQAVETPDLHIDWPEEYAAMEESNKRVLPSKNLRVTSVTPMTHLLGVNNFRVRGKAPPQRKEGKWRRSLDELKLYMDVLAPDMLHAWGYTTVTERENALTSVPASGATEKVQAWLAAVADTDSRSQPEPPIPLVPSEAIETVAVAKAGKKKLPQQPQRTKKRTYVSGF